MSTADTNAKVPLKEPHVVELSARDLPAFCPSPAMPVWNHHPRVFLELATTGQAMCPYCGTVYRLRAGEVPGGH